MELLKELEIIKDLETFEAMHYLYTRGFITNDGEPKRCVYCGSNNMEVYDKMYDNCYLVEYSVRCKDCNNRLGTWSYGSWSI